MPVSADAAAVGANVSTPACGAAAAAVFVVAVVFAPDVLEALGALVLLARKG